LTEQQQLQVVKLTEDNCALMLLQEILFIWKFSGK
jgi:hypothetical protein